MRWYWLFLLFGSMAFADANCVGRSCNDGGDVVVTPGGTDIDIGGTDVDVINDVGVGGTDVSIVEKHPKKLTIKQPPGMAVATPQDAWSAGLTTPIGGGFVTLPADRAMRRLQAFVGMGMAEAGVQWYCADKGRARVFRTAESAVPQREVCESVLGSGLFGEPADPKSEELQLLLAEAEAREASHEDMLKEQQAQIDALRRRLEKAEKAAAERERRNRQYQLQKERDLAPLKEKYGVD